MQACLKSEWVGEHERAAAHEELIDGNALNDVLGQRPLGKRHIVVGVVIAVVGYGLRRPAVRVTPIARPAVIDGGKDRSWRDGWCRGNRRRGGDRRSRG